MDFNKAKDVVDKYINEMFYDIQSEYGIADGDIGIDKTLRLDEIEDELAKLVQDYLKERCGI